MSDVTPSTPLTPLKHPQNILPHDSYKFQLWQLQISTMRVHICQVEYVIIVVKADHGTSTPQMHHWIYMMGCIWKPFWILQEKVGICFYFWMIRLVNSQVALYNHVRHNPVIPPQHPTKHPLKDPYMKIITSHSNNYKFQLWRLIFARCNHCDVVVKADIGRSTPQMHQGIYIMGCICQLFLILQEKVGISFYFCIISLVNSHLAW